MQYNRFFIFLLLIISSMSSFGAGNSYVEVKGKSFSLNQKNYTYLGTNFWYGLNLGSTGEGGDRKRLIRELDKLKSLGIRNLRIMAGSEGPDKSPYRMLPAMQVSPGKYNKDILQGLDFLLSEMNKRNMKAVMCLNNFWPWSGGMSQYLVWAGDSASIPYPPPHPGGSWSEYQTFTAKFYSSKKALKLFNNHIRFIVGRINSITGIAYKEDPAIMSWELANEPRGDKNLVDFTKWIEQTAKLIKDLDKNHLVTTGSEGDTPYPSAGTSLLKDHGSKYIDYATFHIWVQNWSIYDPAKPELTLKKSIDFAIEYIHNHEYNAIILNKPVVLEEFGISRDLNNHDPKASVKNRDEYFSKIFNEVYIRSLKPEGALKGVNFWAWAGEGRPKIIKGLWKKGDDFIGDPPHEHQGWYSVYDKDDSTNLIIKKYTDLFEK
jgi:mannan endo-1,4-beta-mannosidase